MVIGRGMSYAIRARSSGLFLSYVVRRRGRLNEHRAEPLPARTAPVPEVPKTLESAQP